MIEEWKARLIRALGGVVPDRQTFVVEAHMERSEELRTDRLGPGEDDIEGPREPFTAVRDPWRPTDTLGPL